MEAKVLVPSSFSLLYKNFNDNNEIYRDSYLEEIKEFFEKKHKIIIVDGIEGSGKSTMLMQFAKRNEHTSFIYFVNSSCSITYKQDYLLEDIGRQIYYYNYGESPNYDVVFDESMFSKLMFDLIKNNSRKNRSIYFVIDGLDQIEKADYELLKNSLGALPWNTNNFYFVISGNEKKIQTLIPKNVHSNIKQIWIYRFSFEETCSYFKVTNEKDKVFMREISDVWKGHPEDLSQIKNMVDDGVSLENFINDNEINQKKDLLEASWNRYNLENNFDVIDIQLLSIVTFSDNVYDINRISDITGIDVNNIQKAISKYSFLNLEQNNILFNSKSFRNFLNKKLKIHEKKVSRMLIKFYTSRKDYDAITNLPNLYERNKEWSDIITTLSMDNLELIISKSKSFSEINRQIAYGYKAANILTNSYPDLLNFSLYKSTIIGLQKNDNKESQIKSYIYLGKKEEALSLILSISLNEDRFKMLIFYAKICKLKNIEVDEIVINEVRHYADEVDLEYLNENAEDILVGLAYFLPETAITIIEKISGLGPEDSSLEWLINYTASIIDKNKKAQDEDNIIIEKTDSEKKESDFLEKFSMSVGIGIHKVSESDIISHIEKIENNKDRLFLLKSWILKNKIASNIAEIINYAIQLLIHNSAITKPTTTVLLSIISPLKNIKDQIEAEKIISKVEELMLSVNSPTGDKIRIDIKIIEKTIDYNLTLANDKIICLEKFINNQDDYSVRVNALTDLWVLVKKIENTDKYDLEELILEEKYVRDKLLEAVRVILQTTAEHYKELKSVIRKIAKYDFDFAKNICYSFNTEFRRMAGVVECLDVYTNAPINEWNENKIKNTVEVISIDNYYDNAVIIIFSNALEQTGNVRDNLKKIVHIVSVINKVSKNFLKCYVLTKVISMLYLKPDRVGSNLQLTYSSLVKKLENHLNIFWNKIDIPWLKVDTGYNISSDLAEYNKSLAENYRLESELISDHYIIDDIRFANIYFESIRISIRLYCAILAKDSDYRIDKIEYLISQMPSKLERIQLFSELATRISLLNIKEKAEVIVQKKILPIISFYFEKEDKEDFIDVFDSSAVSIYLCQSYAFKHYIDSVPQIRKEDIIMTVLYTLITRNYERDPYEDKIGHKKFSFQEASQFIDLLEYVETDFLIFSQIRRLCLVVKHYPNNFSREYKISIKNRIQKIIDSKLPSLTIGIKHEGYKIATEACLQHFNVTTNDNLAIYEDLSIRASKIPNTADRCYVFTILAEECNIKRKKAEYINIAFAQADEILSIRQKAESYENTLRTAKEISKEVFNIYLRKIQTELYKYDSTETFPTFRKLIDLVYEFDNNMADKFIKAFDSDPARVQLSKPSKNYLSKLELEKEVKEDYSQINKIKSRKEIAITCYTMLGQLNAGKRYARDIDKTIFILKAASKLPSTLALPLVEFFLQNIIKRESTSNKLLIPFYEAACANSKLAYAIISNMQNKGSKLSMDNINGSVDSYLSLPDSRDESFEYIGSIIKSNSPKEIYIIDPYFSAEDLDFIKLFSEWTYEATYYVVSTCDSKKDFGKYTYENAWSKISSEQPPNVKFIKISANKTIDKAIVSPIHDRWILLYDKLVGIRLGTSINAIGRNKVSEISLMSSDMVTDKYNSVVLPIVLNNNKEFQDYNIKYEMFDL